MEENWARYDPSEMTKRPAYGRALTSFQCQNPCSLWFLLAIKDADTRVRCTTDPVLWVRIFQNEVWADRSSNVMDVRCFLVSDGIFFDFCFIFSFVRST